MASLQEIKSRLGSISTTKKITKAMQLVATAKLQKAKSYLESIQEYYTSVEDMAKDLVSNISDLKSLLAIPEQKNSIAYIVVTSDLGLCGGYNSNVMRILKESFKKDKDHLYMIGTKGATAARINGMKLAGTFTNFSQEETYDVAASIAREVIAKYNEGTINKVVMIHTKFINSVTFEAMSSQVMPLVIEKTNNKSSSVLEFEPDPEKIFKHMLPLYVSSLIFGTIVESKVSEMSSRRTSMENATENAEELIDKLDLEYNRARQAAITQEISEIVAGAGGE